MEFQHMVQWRGGALRSVALWLVEAPREIVALLQKAARLVAEEDFVDLYARHADQQVHVRIAGIGVEDSLRDIRCALAGGVGRVQGVEVGGLQGIILHVLALNLTVDAG